MRWTWNNANDKYQTGSSDFCIFKRIKKIIKNLFLCAILYPYPTTISCKTKKELKTRFIQSKRQWLKQPMETPKTISKKSGWDLIWSFCWLQKLYFLFLFKWTVIVKWQLLLLLIIGSSKKKYFGSIHFFFEVTIVQHKLLYFFK